MSEKSRKRTRSPKGQQYDEMLGKRGDEVTEPTNKQKKSSTKSNVSRRIVFGKDSGEKVKGSINNATLTVSTIGKAIRTKNVKISKLGKTKGEKQKKLNKINDKQVDKVKKNKIIDPCFRNVWNKEIQQINPDEIILQDKSDNRDRDGICLTLEGEELDYVDDVIDDPTEFEPSSTAVENDSGENVVVNSGGMNSSSVQQGPSSQTDDEVPTNNVEKRTVAEMNEEELMSLPRVKNLFNQFWEEKMKEMGSLGEETPNCNKQKRCTSKVDKVASPVNMKSPSDTTIYVPALNKSSIIGQRPVMSEAYQRPVQSSMNDIISDFVENVRLEQEAGNNDVNLMERERRRASQEQGNSVIQEAQVCADKAIVEAEKFRATVANPGRDLNDIGQELTPRLNNPQILMEGVGVVHAGHNGKPEMQLSDNLIGLQDNPMNVSHKHIPDIGMAVSDDDFFHLTCHIEPSLIHKIEKGEFIELEKLLPKEKFNRGEENRLKWVQRDGGTFLVPAQRDSKIGSFRRWEQAFRAYATIY